MFLADDFPEIETLPACLAGECLEALRVEFDAYVVGSLAFDDLPNEVRRLLGDMCGADQYELAPLDFYDVNVARVVAGFRTLSF